MSVFFFSKSWVVVACSFWVAHVITRQKSFAFNWPEVRLKEKYNSMSRVPYNKLLTNLACSSRIGEYWPLVIFVRTSRCSVRTVTTSGQHSPVRPLRSVSKRLVSFEIFWSAACQDGSSMALCPAKNCSNLAFVSPFYLLDNLVLSTELTM